MANLWAAACAGVMPLAVMVTARELGATAPVLEIVNSHAARFSPDEDVISIGGHPSAVPLKVTPGIDEVSCRVIALSVKTWGRVPSTGADAATPAPMRTAARPSIRNGAASFRTIAQPRAQGLTAGNSRHPIRHPAQGERSRYFKGTESGRLAELVVRYTPQDQLNDGRSARA